jgi:hypothetical protein
MTFTGRLIDAEHARSLGLLLEVTAPDALLPRSLEIARSIARQPPQALRYTKRLLKMAQRMELRDFLDLCATFQGICHNTDDHLEAVSPGRPALPIGTVYTDANGTHYQVDAAGRHIPLGDGPPAYAIVPPMVAVAPTFDDDRDGVSNQYDRYPHDGRYR